MIGVGLAGIKSSCDFIAFVLHYFALTAVAWTAVHVVQLYESITKVCLQNSTVFQLC